MKELVNYKSTSLKALFLFLFAFLIYSPISASNSPFVISTLDNPAPGYLAFNWAPSNGLMLVDNSGNIPFYNQTSTKTDCFRLSNGFWIQIIDNIKYVILNDNFEIMDTIPNPMLNMPNMYALDWHSTISLANGHYLLLLMKFDIMDLSKVVEDGQTNAMVISNSLIETDRTGTIYWQWNAIDHVSVLDATVDIDISATTIDLTHINSIFEDASGNIYASVRHFDEVIKINKSTGSIIWRLGGSKSKKNQFTFINDDQNGFFGFSHQHSITVLSNGNILLYDNGNLKNQPYSRAVEYAINESAKTATKVWEYSTSPAIFQMTMGSVQRLPNGNTLINWGRQKITEVRPNNTVAFELIYPDFTNVNIYQATRVITKMDAVTKNLNSYGNYYFNDGYYNTDITLSLSSINGSGSSQIEKHYYKPSASMFNDTTFSDIFPYRWVFTGKNINTFSGNIKINLNRLNIPKPEKTSVYMRSKEGEGTFYELTNSYNQNTNEITANISSFGEFILVDCELDQPTLSKPINNTTSKIKGKLEWNRLIGATNYQIQISKVETFIQTNLNAVVEDVYQFNFDSLENDTKYYWRVRGFNKKDTSDWSNVYNFRTAIAYPKLSTPTNNFVGTKIASIISWQYVSGATHYHLQVSKNSNFASIHLENVNITNNSFPLSELSYNTKYYWRVRAHRVGDTSDWSPIWNFRTTLPPTTLLSPSNIKINVPVTGELTWAKNTGAASYLLELSETLDFSQIFLKSVDLKSESFNYYNLKFNTKYYWRVCAYRGTDTSDWSDIWEFNTLLEHPTLQEPTNYSVNHKLPLLLHWQSVYSSASYTINIATDESFKNIIIDTTTTDTTSFKLTDLSPNKKFYWRIATQIDSSFSDWSETWTFSTGNTILSSPKLYLPNIGATIQTHGALSWYKIYTANKYRIQIAKDNIFSELHTDTLIGNTFQFFFDNLQSSEKYFWRVKAYTHFDSTAWSDVWWFNTTDQLPIAKLLTPKNEELQVLPYGKFTWLEVNSANEYQIQLSTNSDFINNLQINEVVKKTEFEYFNLAKNTEFFWRVRYIMNSDTSDWSSVWSFTTQSEEILSSPKLISPENGLIGLDIIGKLHWENVPNAEKYHFSFSNTVDFDSLIFSQKNLSETSYSYNNLKYNAQYFWRVAAFNSTSTSNWSETYNFTTELEPPTITSPTTNTTEQPLLGVITWKVNDINYLFAIQIARDENFTDLVYDIPEIESSDYQYELEENQLYFVRVRSIADNNQSKWSSVVKFKTKLGNSISTNDINEILYPNPVKDHLIINDNLAGQSQFYEIYDSQGNPVQNGEVKSRIDLHLLPNGEYFLKFDCCEVLKKFLKLN